MQVIAKTRDADNSDIIALERVKKPAVLHKDRIRDAASGEFRYLVLEDDCRDILGHACLVFARPKAWPLDDGYTPYPRVIDLTIREQNRRKGMGKEFMRQMESICIRMGLNQLHLSVDPEDNASAVRFYQSLGYTATQKPQWREWSFRDSEGNAHQGEGMDLRMTKKLRNNAMGSDATSDHAGETRRDRGSTTASLSTHSLTYISGPPCSGKSVACESLLGAFPDLKHVVGDKYWI
jgi:GNAT superfamily N-acetyltransferase